MSLFLETLLIMMLVFAIGLGVGWLIWAPKSDEAAEESE